MDENICIWAELQASDILQKSTQELIDFLIHTLNPASVLNFSTSLKTPGAVTFNSFQAKSRFELGITSSCSSGDEFYDLLEQLVYRCDYIVCPDIYRYEYVMLSLAYFMKKYRTLLKCSHTLFSAGSCNLIIEPLQGLGEADVNLRSAQLANAYDSHYHPNDCRGYEACKARRGEILNAQLLPMLLAADIRQADQVLDIGSGSGELAYFIHKHCGCAVTGVDSDRNAVKTAQETFGPHSDQRLSYAHGDILAYLPEQTFDKVIASDVAEHMVQDQLDILFAKVADELLSINGLFVIHTSSNKLHYAVDYEQRRQHAQAIGLYMPKNPRSYFEDLMHINEQTKDGL